MRRVLLDATSLKISKPGFDVDTALPSQLLLYIGLNFGQILEMGMVYLKPSGFNESYVRSATVSIGPYSATPEVFAWGIFEGQWKAIPVWDSQYQIRGMFPDWEMVISPGPSSIQFIAKRPRGSKVDPVNADHAFYICYRKPF